MRFFALVFGLVSLCLASPIAAQTRMWLQVEAQPDLNTALDRARAYASLFPDVEGYQLDSGWYAITIGPQDRDAAALRLLDLRRQNLIPNDSFLADGGNFGQRFWPVGSADALPLESPEDIAEAPLTDSTATEPVVVPEPAPEPAPETVIVTESLEDSRAAEAALDEPARKLLQEALKWYGFYDAAVDGSFGRGTRASMAAWQETNGYEPTGVLSTDQRDRLTSDYAADQAAFGFKTVTEGESGIEISLPLALVEFDRYEPPFVHYKAKDGSGLRVILISEPGGTAALASLYDILQSLEIMPPDGPRSLEETRFSLRGRNATTETLAVASVQSGNVKGYIVSWDPAQGERMARILPALDSSFRSLGDQVLDPGLVPLTESVRRGLLSGLEMRHPTRSRSGFFVDAKGSVLTTVEAVSGCGKIILERSTEAQVAFSDATTGVALLTPTQPLSPSAVAAFATAAPRPGARVSLSGYSYEDRLPAPVVTPGTVEETMGLNGETGLTRLTLDALPGDTGGPILDADGAVLGMLVPSATALARDLPQGVAFAASASALTALLAAQGLTAPQADGTHPTPDDLAARARGMTVLVSCWE